MQIPRAAPGMICPLHRKDMAKVCHKCPWWTRLIGKHPQTEEVIDRWQCAISTLPTLLVENSQGQRQTAAVLETFRNGVVESIMTSIAHAAQAAQRRLHHAGEHQRD